MGDLRSFFKVLLVTSVIALCSNAQAGPTFVEQCLAKTEILKKPLTCETSDFSFTLNLGTSVSVTALKAKGSAPLAVSKIVHLPPRVEDMGVLDEAIRFVATNEKLVATVTIPCGQDSYGYVGLSVNAKVLPHETVAQCHY